MKLIQFKLNSAQEEDAQEALEQSDCSNLNMLAKKLLLEHVAGQRNLSEQVEELKESVQQMQAQMSDLMQSHATMDLSGLLTIMAAVFKLTYDAVAGKHREELEKYLNVAPILELVTSGGKNG